MTSLTLPIFGDATNGSMLIPTSEQPHGFGAGGSPFPVPEPSPLCPAGRSWNVVAAAFAVPAATLLKKAVLAALFVTLCAGISVAEFVPLEEAKEIIDGRTILTDPRLPVNTYKSKEDPDNPGHEISDADWTCYTPPLPYIKNTTRNLQFNESDFIASPGAPDGVTDYIQTRDGYTWATMSAAINALWPYNAADYSGFAAVNAYYAGNLVTTPGEGVVKVTVNFKAQNMKFYANEGGVPSNTPGAVTLDRYVVKDQWDNTYIMHASGQMDQSQVSAAFSAAVLPAGWMKQTIQLDEDLILNPAQGADGSYHYLVFRDSADNTYHQTGWGSQGISLAAQVEGMPIWGGQTSDLLLGDVTGITDDLMHGAGGDDTIQGGLGNDIIWGDAGSDTAVLGEALTSCTLLDYSEDLTWIQLSRGGYTTDFHHVEYFRFSDVTLSAEAVVLELGALAVPEIDPAGMGSALAFITGCLGLLETRRLKRTVPHPHDASQPLATPRRHPPRREQHRGPPGLSGPARRRSSAGGDGDGGVAAAAPGACRGSRVP